MSNRSPCPSASPPRSAALTAAVAGVADNSVDGPSPTSFSRQQLNRVLLTVRQTRDCVLGHRRRHCRLRHASTSTTAPMTTCRSSTQNRRPMPASSHVKPIALFPRLRHHVQCGVDGTVAIGVADNSVDGPSPTSFSRQQRNRVLLIVRQIHDCVLGHRRRQLVVSGSRLADIIRIRQPPRQLVSRQPRTTVRNLGSSHVKPIAMFIGVATTFCGVDGTVAGVADNSVDGNPAFTHNRSPRRQLNRRTPSPSRQTRRLCAWSSSPCTVVSVHAVHLTTAPTDNL